MVFYGAQMYLFSGDFKREASLGSIRNKIVNGDLYIVQKDCNTHSKSPASASTRNYYCAMYICKPCNRSAKGKNVALMLLT